MLKVSVTCGEIGVKNIKVRMCMCACWSIKQKMRRPLLVPGQALNFREATKAMASIAPVLTLAPLGKIPVDFVMF